ncbi:hypothetical protein Abr02nite_17750 [Paractinoplanes brasiliensis]|nr:hypothetical protein Abr02nite_17750 [Actinoplanes brasiliensis]
MANPGNTSPGSSIADTSDLAEKGEREDGVVGADVGGPVMDVAGVSGLRADAGGVRALRAGVAGVGGPRWSTAVMKPPATSMRTFRATAPPVHAYGAK